MKRTQQLFWNNEIRKNSDYKQQKLLNYKRWIKKLKCIILNACWRLIKLFLLNYKRELMIAAKGSSMQPWRHQSWLRDWNHKILRGLNERKPCNIGKICRNSKKNKGKKVLKENCLWACQTMKFYLIKLNLKGWAFYEIIII